MLSHFKLDYNLGYNRQSGLPSQSGPQSNSRAYNHISFFSVLFLSVINQYKLAAIEYLCQLQSNQILD